MGVAHAFLCRATPLHDGEEGGESRHALRALAFMCGLSPTGFP
ncbi:hypothetical protein [Arachidicoccus ginsenosidivorans]|jgi:hypothetical protein|nr:hypothetical protein [Arachidicoccus ginsenosidivorans]